MHSGDEDDPHSIDGANASGGRIAAFFDLDKTVIARSSTLALARSFYSGGLISGQAALRTSYAHLMFRLGGADHAEMERLRDHMSAMSAGWEVAKVQQIVNDALTDLIEPMVYREATELIAQHQAAGHDVYLVSASGQEVVEPIGEMLGVDGVIASRMSVKNGRYTGAMDFYAYGQNKAEAITTLSQARGYTLGTCYAYSDSITDVPMLEAVGNPSAVNPDRALRAYAQQRRWPISTFCQPVTLRSRMAGQWARMPQPTNPAVLVTVGAGLLLLALATYASLSRAARTKS